MNLRRFLLTLLFLSFFSTYAQSISEAKQEALIKILYQHASDEGPGLAVGILKDGKVVYEGYVGYANLEHKVKIDNQTRFNIASNAKQFTALCALKLIEDGKLDLKDDIRKYLPDLYKKVEEPITIADLLAHTSGIRDISALWALKGQTWWKMFLDNDDAIELLKGQTALNFKPGSAYIYSNSNYVLLTEIIKKVRGRSFGEVSKAMFAEMDMPNTSFLTNYMAVIPNKARPYGDWNGWKEYPAITEIHGDGGLFTTLNDQLQWERIVQLNDGQYLPKDYLDQSQKPIANSYGYGLMFDDFNGLNYTYHDGSTGAYHATFLRFPTEKISFVVMANSGDVPSNYLAWQMAFLLLGLESENKVYPEGPEKVENLNRLHDVVGNYKNEDGSIIRIVEKEGNLYREMYQRDPVKLIPEKQALFEYETIPGLKMNFSNIGKAEQQFTLYLSTQKPATYHRLHDSSLDGVDKNELKGTYVNEETDTEVELTHLDNYTYSIILNGRERKAELWVKDFLKMNDYEIVVRRDEQGTISGLSVNNDRIRNVVFRRR